MNATERKAKLKEFTDHPEKACRTGIPITYHGSIIKADADPRVDTLLKAIEPFFIRVKKSDLGIPQATEHEPIMVPMGEAQRRIYDVIEKKYMSDIVSSRDSWFRQDLVKARLLRMMQAATNPITCCRKNPSTK